MNIFFDSALDGRAWPHWSGEQKGKLGEIRVGQLGMLGRLETMLGLRGPEISEGVRIASLVPFIQGNKSAFWAKSAEVDPFGVARELLHFHDFLVMYGWKRQAITPRLADIASFSEKILPGGAQRLEAVLSELDDFDAELPSITFYEPINTLPFLWQNIFRKLERMGVVCNFLTIPPVQNVANDLGAARSGKFMPVGDGSLQLIRPDGVLQAAEDIAAWLAVVAQEEGLHNTLIIGSDAVLDRALHQFGLPVTGAAAESGNSLLQLLPLVLAMGWNPPDPARIMELLTLPASPVPLGIGRRLSSALAKWPALGSQLWQEKLDEGLAAIEDHVQRERTAERLRILFTPMADCDYPVTEIERRVGMLAGWLTGRFHDDTIVYPAISQCQIFLAMIAAMELEHLNEPLLKKLLDEATSSLATLPSLPAQVGLAAVQESAAVIGPAQQILWWNFSRNTVPTLTGPLLSEEEQKALADAGVHLPDSAILASSRAARWRRPLACATQQLILVCPLRDAAGEEIHPHPLWDELLAASDDKAKDLIATRIHSSLTIPTITLTKIPLPQPQTHWQVAPGTVKSRDMESPSSLENFLGCPLKWCLTYNAQIRSGHLATLPDMAPTKGSLAHELLGEILSQDTLPLPDDGAKLAGLLFDRKAPRMVATLFQEGMEAEREDVRNTVVLSTRSLLQHLHDAKTGKITIEQHLTGTFGSQQLQGWADIVLEKPFTVIDLKRSWAKFFKEKMISGTALQIIIYGWLLKEARGTFPKLAYYTLEDQTFLTTDADNFPSGEAVATPPVADVWQTFEDTFYEAWQVLKSGRVLCPGNGEEVKSRLDDDRLILEPPCRFCDYGVLCGRGLS